MGSADRAYRAVSTDGSRAARQGQRRRREVVVETTYEGIEYEYANPVAFEFNNDGRIRARRSYYDKLGIEQRIARQYPGIQGYLFRLILDYLVPRGEKGLRKPGEARR